MDINEYLIRKAKLYDVPAIASIERNTSNTPWSADALTKDVTKNDKAYVAVAALPCEEGDVPEIIGYADMWVVAGEAQLNNIAIDERYRGNHIGEALLSHMLEKSRELGCDLMTLEVRSGNTAARSLYKKAGFTEAGVRRGYYRDNREDAILMNRNIGDVEVDYSTEDHGKNHDEDQRDTGLQIDIEIETTIN